MKFSDNSLRPFFWYIFLLIKYFLSVSVLSLIFVSRSDIGYEKYGRTLDNERRGKFKNLAGYLMDIQEELMDAVLYIQAAREELEDREKEV